MGLNTETHFYNSPPQYSLSRLSYIQTIDKHSISLPTIRPAILLVKYPLAYIHY
jgi:hypothetical protein